MSGYRKKYIVDGNTNYNKNLLPTPPRKTTSGNTTASSKIQNPTHASPLLGPC